MPYIANKDKPYNPKTEKNRRSWKAVQDTLAKGKGKAELKEIQKALSYTYTDDKGTHEEAHANFVRYMIRGRHLVESK